MTATKPLAGLTSAVGKCRNGPTRLSFSTVPSVLFTQPTKCAHVSSVPCYISSRQVAGRSMRGPASAPVPRFDFGNFAQRSKPSVRGFPIPNTLASQLSTHATFSTLPKSVFSISASGSPIVLYSTTILGRVQTNVLSQLIHWRSKRWSSSGSAKDSTNASKKSWAKTEAESPSSGDSSTVAHSPDGRLPSIAHSAGSTLRRVTQLSIGDLLSVYGVVFLIVTIVFAPYIANQMRKSESTYDDFEESLDDPVAHIEYIFRKEFNQTLQGEATEGEDSAHADGTVDLLADMLKSSSLQDAVASLIAQVVQSERFQTMCQKLLKDLWNDLVTDPETTAQVVQLLNNAIQNKDIQDSVKKLVLELIKDKEVYDELTRLLVRLGQEDRVLDATQKLLTNSAHNALNDPEILDHSMEFATDVVGDDIVQRTSGEALRNTVTYAVGPGLSTFLSIVGVALFLFGVTALGTSRATDQEAELVDKALSSVARNIATATNEGFSSILSFPGQVLSTCISLVATVASLPVRAAQHGFARLGRAGDATLQALTRIISGIVSLPGRAIQSTIHFVQSMTQHGVEGISYAVQRFTVMISESFVGASYRFLSHGTTSVLTSIAASSRVIRASLAASVVAIQSLLSSSWTMIGSLATQASTLVASASTVTEIIANAAREAGKKSEQTLSIFIDACSTTVAAISSSSLKWFGRTDGGGGATASL